MSDPWPLCRFHAPRWVYPGDEVDVGVDLLCDVEVEVDRIELFVVAKNGLGLVRADDWMAGELVAKDEDRTFTTTLELSGATRLPIGSSVFATKFVVPEETPPSHSFGGAFAYLGMEARVVYERTRTYLYWFWTRVRPPKRPLTRAPLARAGLGANAGLEIAVASTEIAPGEAIEGAVVVPDERGKVVQLALVGELVAPRQAVQRFVAVQATVALPPGSRGIAVPFRIPVPDLMATFTASSHALVWSLHASRPAWMRATPTVAIPMTVVDTLLARDTPLPTAIPAIGDPAVASVFETHAREHDWDHVDRLFADDDLGLVRPVIKRAHGDAELALAHAYRADAMAVVARVRYPRLGLALQATRDRRHAVGGERLRMRGAPGWHFKHQVVARDERQATPFVLAVAAALRPELGELARWSDDEIVFARVARGRVHAAELVAAEAMLVELSGEIARARERIAPPEAVDLETWVAYVRELRGTLTAGDLSVDGVVGTYPVAIDVRWQRDRPTHVDVRVGDPDTASEDALAVAVASPHPGAEVAGLATKVSWPEDIIDFFVEDGVAGATWQLVAGPLATPRVRALVEALHLVRRGLDVEIGPYR